jgi:hypothetical protein
VGAGSPETTGIVVKYALPGLIPAGVYRLTADGIVKDKPNVSFDIGWSQPAQTTPTRIVQFIHQFPDSTDASMVVQYEDEKQGTRIEAKEGDSLVFRIHVLSGSPTETATWIPLSERASTPKERMLKIRIP